jgi:hypothetical protein
MMVKNPNYVKDNPEFPEMIAQIVDSAIPEGIQKRMAALRPTYRAAISARDKLTGVRTPITSTNEAEAEEVEEFKRAVMDAPLGDSGGSLKKIAAEFLQGTVEGETEPFYTHFTDWQIEQIQNWLDSMGR